MIKVESKINTDSDENSFKIEAFADTKEEVVPGATFVGLPKNAKIEMGSVVRTADLDIAYMQSTGNWHWVGE